ncbi:MAG: elongation factor P maturation arginine rhamnosyltransferase EarP, partial [Limnohabitans sp.]
FVDWLHAPESLRRMHRLWNGIEAGPLPSIDAAMLSDWKACSRAARARLVQQPGLLPLLLQSVLPL